MAQHNRIPLSARRVHLWQLPRSVRRVRALGPLALTLVLVLVAAILLGSIGHPRASTGATGHVGAASLLIARADVHVETVLNGKNLEMNLAITQTKNDCQEALNGGVCLRYTVVLDGDGDHEQALLAGYGVIPQANVNMTASSIVLKTDTSKIPNFVHVVGQGGPILINWKALSAVTKAGAVRKATAQGGIAQYTIPSNGVIASMLFQ